MSMDACKGSAIMQGFFIGLQKNMADKLQDYLTNLKMHDAKYRTTFIYGAKEAIICYIS